MSKTKKSLNFDYDVRIPEALIQQMMDGEITGAMLLTMNVLYKWSNWGTGIVRHVCASSLCLATHKAFSERTFSEALRKLEWMRWITRHMVAGSTSWYPVILHNYKRTDDAGKIHIINPTQIVAYDKFPEGRCDEASWEASDAGSDEASDEGSDRHESEHKSKLQSENESELQCGESKSVSERVSGSFASLTPSVLAEEILNHLFPVAVPYVNDEDVKRLNDAAAVYKGTDWNAFFSWHRTHKPPKLVFRTVEKFLEGIGYALNDYANHDLSTCATCVKLKVKYILTETPMCVWCAERMSPEAISAGNGVCTACWMMGRKADGSWDKAEYEKYKADKAKAAAAGTGIFEVEQAE